MGQPTKRPRQLTPSWPHAAMSFLIPIGVVFYAAIGGLKATFTTSYFHTVIVYVVCCVFLYKVFIPNDLLGGIDDVRRLQCIPPCHYCAVAISYLPWHAVPMEALLERWQSHAQVYARLKVMTANLPVQGNQDGSYLTGFSSGGLQ